MLFRAARVGMNDLSSVNSKLCLRFKVDYTIFESVFFYARNVRLPVDELFTRAAF